MRDSMTVAEARKILFVEARGKGSHCPCCRKFVKVYKRKFNAGMARALLYSYPLFTKYPGRWLDIGKLCAKRHDFISGEHAKLIWWGLLERKSGEPETGAKILSRYRLTQVGKNFAELKSTVPSHAIEYRSKVIEFVGKQITIEDALGRNFNYHELMRGIAA